MTIGERLVQQLEADGYLPVLVIGFREDPATGEILPRVVTPSAFPEILTETPTLQQAIQDIIANLIQVGKPPDDRKLSPGTKVKFIE